jgi:hypothetical protein
MRERALHKEKFDELQNLLGHDIFQCHLKPITHLLSGWTIFFLAPSCPTLSIRLIRPALNSNLLFELEIAVFPNILNIAF